jgi:hypothetical protein
VPSLADALTVSADIISAVRATIRTFRSQEVIADILASLSGLVSLFAGFGGQESYFGLWPAGIDAAPLPALLRWSRTVALALS